MNKGVKRATQAAMLQLNPASEWTQPGREGGEGVVVVGGCFAWVKGGWLDSKGSAGGMCRREMYRTQLGYADGQLCGLMKV
jgi:hypothetical protein